MTTKVQKEMDRRWRLQVLKIFRSHTGNTEAAVNLSHLSSPGLGGQVRQVTSDPQQEDDLDQEVEQHLHSQASWVEQYRSVCV